MASVLEGFHPALRAWFERRFVAPSRVQELGWPVIRESESGPSHDVLLCAPTGSGKTLAAFMWAINRLVTQAERDELRDEVSVLYVSPLKALANDIRLNLDEPLDGIRQVAAECGLELAGVHAGLRTGDTSASERGAMLRRAPHILVTTPESLFILLTSPRFREKLRAVRYVVVDELHALAGNKRGAHLAITLERLERMVRRDGGPRPTRIGLSATLNPVERLAAFLAGAEIGRDGARRSRPVHAVRADDGARSMDVRVLAPGPDLGPIATHQHWEAMYDELARLIGEHRTTLVFTLSRRWAERIALNLQKRLGADAVMAHHGSLARNERLMAEQRLKRGELSAIVATASLELGIDVGTVDLVCQVDSPKSISAAIQRIGRSGHSLSGTPKGRFFALTLDDLMECAAVVRAIRRGCLDEVEIPTGCLDVAAQQIVAIAAEEGEIDEAELLLILRRADNFANLDLGTLRRLLSEMAAERRARIPGAGPKIFYDRVGGRVRARRGARLAAITSGGTIPESGNYDVVIQSEGRKIGDVEEDFAQESSRGDIFALGSTPWRILGVSRSRLMVEPAPGMAPTLPFWQTEASGRSIALSAALCELRRDLAVQLGKPGGAGGAAALLCEQCALDERAAAQARAYMQRALGALGAMPDERTLIVERFFDGLGGTQIVIHTPFGIRLNRGLGLALRKRLCQLFDFEIQASALDDGVLLALNARHSFALERLFEMLNSRTVGTALVQALLDAPMFEVRFRHVATRALEVMRSAHGRRIPAWLQRLRTQELMGAIFPARQACFENRPGAIEVPAHFLVQETMRECLEEATDLPRLVRLLEGLEAGRVCTRAVDAVAPSVMAQRILLAWDYSFLDGGERANRRSRTVAMNRAMAEDVLREEDLSAMLSAEAVESVAAEVSGRASARRARDRDELCELIRAHGAIEEAALAERTNGDAGAMASELEREGRVLRGRLFLEGREMLLAAEDAPMFAAAYPDISFIAASGKVEAARSAPFPLARYGRAGDEMIEPDRAREEIVRRALATSGPTSAPEIAERLSMPAVAVELALCALEAKGDVFRGHFTPSSHRVNGDCGEQWCDRYNLEKIHRLTLGRIRAEIEPCTDREFAAFRLAWQHVGGAGLTPDQSGVALVLEQLSGLAFNPGFWEEAILPARIPGYRPEYLDMLCMSGEMSWVAMPDRDDVADVPSRVAFFKRRRPPLWARERPALTDPKECAIYEALLAGGAQYLDQVAERAGLSERDAVQVLWRLSAAGWASNDSFVPLRMLRVEGGAGRAITSSSSVQMQTHHDAALRARLKSSISGRWSAFEAGRKSPDARPREFDYAREVAMFLLERNGLLTREMLIAEPDTIPWPELSFTLRRMEYAGTIRRGYFVRTLSGEQYALPAAAEMLRAMRGLDSIRERPVALAAADPANPYGFLLPACGVARESGNVVVLRGGEMVLGLAGHTLVAPGPLDDEAFCAAVSAIIAYRPKVVVETIDGCPALESSRVPALAAMGFHSDGKALRYDGLAGPLPIRARTSPSSPKAMAPAGRPGSR